jgi:hypothetical protein
LFIIAKGLEAQKYFYWIFVFQVKTDYVKEQQEEDSQNGQGASMGGAGALGAGRPSRSQQMQ